MFIRIARGSRLAILRARAGGMRPWFLGEGALSLGFAARGCP